MKQDIECTVQTCKTCQQFKKTRKKYGKLPVKDHESDSTTPWSKIAVDLIGPWIIPQAGQIEAKKNPPKLLALTIIDVATNFMELIALSDKESATVATAVDKNWFCRYPRPVECIHERF